MNRARVLVALRIAFSALCGIVCLLLIVLWMRSYSFVEWLQGPVSSQWYLVLGSTDGQMRFNRIHNSQWTPPQNRLWEYQYMPVSRAYSDPSSRPKWWQFALARNYVNVPVWFVVLLVSSLASAQWITWSKIFSRRTLLIAMTVMAAAIGLLVAGRR